MEVLEKVARSEASTVLVQGESVPARNWWQNGFTTVPIVLKNPSLRSTVPLFPPLFLKVNCSAREGAFTDAKATKKGYLN